MKYYTSKMINDIQRKINEGEKKFYKRSKYIEHPYFREYMENVEYIERTLKEISDNKILIQKEIHEEKTITTEKEL